MSSRILRARIRISHDLRPMILDIQCLENKPARPLVPLPEIAPLL